MLLGFQEAFFVVFSLIAVGVFSEVKHALAVLELIKVDIVDHKSASVGPIILSGKTDAG